MRRFGVLAFMAVAAHARLSAARASAGARAPDDRDRARLPRRTTARVLATYSAKRLTTGKMTKEMERLPSPSRAYLSAPDRKRQFVRNLV
jgi:hypothetical protein